MYDFRSPGLNHPAVLVSKEEYKRQNRLISTLPWLELRQWLDKEFFRRLRNATGPVKPIASSVQMKLVKRKELEILQGLAKHPHLTPDAFDELMKLNKNWVYRALAERRDLTPEWFKELLSAIEGDYSFRSLVTNSTLSSKQRAEVIEKCFKVLSPIDAYKKVYAVLNRTKPLELKEFNYLIFDVLHTAKDNLREIYSYPGLPLELLEEAFSEKNLEKLKGVAENSSLSEETLDRLIAFDDEEINASLVAGSRNLNAQQIKGFLSPDGFQIPIGDLSYFLSRRTYKLTEDHISLVIDRVRGLTPDENKTAHKLHYFLVWHIDDLPKDFVLELNDGKFGDYAQDESWMRKELPIKRIRALSKEDDVTKKMSVTALKALASNENINQDLQRKLSYTEASSYLSNHHKTLEVDEDFAWQFFIQDSYYEHSFVPWRERERKTTALLTQAIDEIGEDFANIWLRWEGSLREVVQSYRKLKS